MRKLMVTLVVLLMIVSFVSCGGESAPDGNKTDESNEVVLGGVFRFPLAQPVPTIDPAQLTDTTSHEVGKQLFEGLVQYDIDLNIIPSLAESWDISDDGAVYTFHLRDALFNNGETVTADDVKWSFERVLAPETASPRTWILIDIVGAKDFNDGVSTEVTGMKVVDEKTLEITIEHVSPVFLHKLTYSSAWVLHQESVEAGEAEEDSVWYEKNPVGTGPFVLDDWKRNQMLTLLPNENYWGEKPRIDKLEYYIHKEDTVRQQEYESGNIDYNLVADAEFQRIKADKILSSEMSKVDQLGIQYIGFRTHIPPFDNKKFRKAFCYAVDRNAIIEKIYNNRYTLATGILPPSMPHYKSETDAYPYDPTMAKNMLDEAIEEGLNLPEKITFAYNKGTATHRDVAEFIQNQIMNNLGIELVLEEFEWSDYLEKIDQGEFPVFRLGWIADYPEPDNFLWVLLASENAGPKGGASFFSNQEFDDLVNRAMTTMDTATRMELYKEAEVIAMEEAPWMPINFMVNWFLLKSYVKGFRMTPMGTLPHNLVEINK